MQQSYFIPALPGSAFGGISFGVYILPISPILPLPVDLVPPYNSSAAILCSEVVSGLTASVMSYRLPGLEYGSIYVLDVRPDIRLTFDSSYIADPRLPEITLAILRSLIPG